MIFFSPGGYEAYLKEDYGSFFPFPLSKFPSYSRTLSEKKTPLTLNLSDASQLGWTIAIFRQVALRVLASCVDAVAG